MKLARPLGPVGVRQGRVLLKTPSRLVERINSVGEYSPRNLQTADERADQVFAARVGLQGKNDVLRAGMAAFIAVPR